MLLEANKDTSRIVFKHELLDANKSSLKHISVHINQQKDIFGLLASLSSACLCHHEINHQHKYKLAAVSKH
jgi:hypothetical protein